MRMYTKTGVLHWQLNMGKSDGFLTLAGEEGQLRAIVMKSPKYILYKP